VSHFSKKSTYENSNVRKEREHLHQKACNTLVCAAIQFNSAIMPTRRNFLKTIASTAAVSTAAASTAAFAPLFGDDGKQTSLITANDGLQSLAAQKNMFFGTGTAEDRIIADVAYRNAIVRECGMIVPEYEMKWDRMRPSATTYNFSDADFIINYARQNALTVRGHTLCWHRALPSWFSSTVNASNAARFLTEHIQTVCSRYRGRIHSWDVVNEAIEPTDRQTNNLRNTPWFRFLGESYIETAFRAASQADPSAMLVYNEYGFEFDDNVRRNAVLGLLRRLQARNVPIHALGIQGHLRYADLAKFNANTNSFRTFLRDVAALGLKIIITEFDVDDNTLPSGIMARDEGIGKMYGDFCAVVMNEPAVIGFITWGLSDKYTSLNAIAPRPDRQPQRPLPLDSSMVRKSAWYALEFWFKNTAARPRQIISGVQQGAGQQGAMQQDGLVQASLSCSPNPVTDVIAIEFTLPIADEVLVRLVDVQGRDVKIIARQALAHGEHRITTDVRSLSSGVYAAIVQGSSFLASKNIVVQR
jgi:endo-1,4-beta-xylanase